ncbi:MAG: hypothetical protein ACT4P0_06740 [Panacagrimonas sp.]
MKISSPRISRTDSGCEYRVRVETADGQRALWYQVDSRWGESLSSSCDAAAVALLIPAMARGEDLEVQGALSQRLFYHLSGPVQAMLKLVLPQLRCIRILANEVVCERLPTTGYVASGFSAGVDSFAVLADHFYDPAPPGFRLTHLLFNNVGSHGLGGEGLFWQRHERTAKVAARIGLPLIAINSNQNEFYKGFTFQKTHTLRNVSVALALQGGVARFFYASAGHYADCRLGPTSDMAQGDFALVPALATENIDTLSVGGQYSRVEKLLRVARIEDSLQTLDVCLSGSAPGNCSMCRKCVRTLLILEIAGMLNRYEAVFDLSRYRHKRSWGIRNIIDNSEPIPQEIVRFARERGYALVP